MSLIAPAAETVGACGDRPLADYLMQLEQASMVKTLDNLMTFPFVRILVESQRLQLHAAYFDVAIGLLSIRDSMTGNFARLGAAGKEESNTA